MLEQREDQLEKQAKEAARYKDEYIRTLERQLKSKDDMISQQANRIHEVNVSLNETLNRSLAWISNVENKSNNMSLMNLSDNYSCGKGAENFSYPKAKCSPVKAKSVERDSNHHLEVPSQQTTKRAREEEPVFFIGGNKKKKLSID